MQSLGLGNRKATAETQRGGHQDNVTHGQKNQTQ